VCWMDSKKLVPGAKYFVQHNTNRVLKLTAWKTSLQLIFRNYRSSQLAINEIEK
jgi:sulfate adenylyltransferase subunit 1